MYVPLPEVVGDAGVVVESLDAEGLAEAMLAVLHDPVRYRALREAGLSRAATFSWRASALLTTHLYHQILGEEHVQE